MSGKKVVDYDELYPGRFLKMGLLKGRDVTVTIKAIELETLEGEKGDEQKGVVSFVESPLCMTLNKTNGLCLRAMFGRNVGDWIGKRVTLYPDPTIKIGGEVVGGIRLRGSPDIAAPVGVEIKLRKRKAINVTMAVTGKAAPASTAMHDPNAQPPAGA